MNFLSPWSLLGLLPVVAVAAWALFRPGRHFRVVGSLELWRKAVASTSRSSRRARRVSASWMLLLAGAAAGVLACARPVYFASRPSRRVAIALLPAAEIATVDGMGALRGSARKLLDRLDGEDRVQVVLPDVLGGASEWLTVDEAKGMLNGIGPLPAGAAELTLPQSSDDAQHVYRFAPASAERQRGRVSAVELPTDLPAMVLVATGAEALGDGSCQVMMTARDADDRGGGRLHMIGLDGPDRRGTLATGIVEFAGPEATIVRQLPASKALAIEITGLGKPFSLPSAAAFFVRREAMVRTVAMIGPDEPLVRRFVKVAPWLEMVADPADADVVIASVEQPPAGAAALLINPRRSPPGWRRASDALRHVRLDAADLAADDPVLRDVDFAGAVVRSVQPWIAADGATQRRLVTLGGDGLVLRTEADGLTAARRLYVAFDLSAENTTFTMSESFVIFLASAMRWLAPGGRHEVRYEFVTPLAAGPQPTWRRLLGAAPPEGPASPLPWPGIYVDDAGTLHAVTLAGLRAARPTETPEAALAALGLPEPRRVETGTALWSLLTIATVVLWWAGWTLRLR